MGGDGGDGLGGGGGTSVAFCADGGGGTAVAFCADGGGGGGGFGLSTHAEGGPSFVPFELA